MSEKLLLLRIKTNVKDSECLMVVREAGNYERDGINSAIDYWEKRGYTGVQARLVESIPLDEHFAWGSDRYKPYFDKGQWLYG